VWAAQVAYPFLWLLPGVVAVLSRLRPGAGAAVLIPSSLLRYLTFKLTWDLQQIPALHELARAAIRLLLNRDTSQWDRAIQMPHYNTRSMPAISLHTGMHLIQACL
jgi:lysosomal acid lipase/cholesteryl ester hydrolase